MRDSASELSFRAEQLIDDFEHRRGGSAEFSGTLRLVIGRSPALARQIDSAVSKGLLSRLELLSLDSSAVGEYHTAGRLIRLRPDLESEPGTVAFVLGHETQHALNSPITSRAIGWFHQEVAHIASTTHDYTRPVRTLIRSSRWDESSSTLAGLNALVGYVRGTRREAQLSDVFDAAPNAVADFIIGEDRTAQYLPSFEANEDLTIPITPDNIEAVAREYFDKSPDETMLGARGTSDYANYYGAWAIGAIVPSHLRSAPVQPMRIDLASLGLIRQIMEENGIDLHGVQQQAYVDASTQPPTQDFFHHTMGTFRYVPPTGAAIDPANDPSTDRAFEALRLASLGFARPPTAAIRLPSGIQLSARGQPAVAVRNVRPKRTVQSNSVS